MKGRRSASDRKQKPSPKQLGDIMTTRVATIEPKEAASSAWSRMRRRGIRHLVVTENGRLRGVLSERDVVAESAAGFRKGLMVEDLASPRTVSAESKTTLHQAADLMGRRHIGCLPVVDNGRLVGIVTATDVLDELSRDSVRTPFPPYVPRALKRGPSRTPAKLVPAHIRVLGSNLTKDQRIRIREELGVKLGKFRDFIERVSIRVKDVNGPRGGIDQLCRIKIVLRNLPSIIVERQDANLLAAVGGCLAGVERTVRRKLERRRVRSTKVASASATYPG